MFILIRRKMSCELIIFGVHIYSHNLVGLDDNINLTFGQIVIFQ